MSNDKELKKQIAGAFSVRLLYRCPKCGQAYEYDDFNYTCATINGECHLCVLKERGKE